VAAAVEVTADTTKLAAFQIRAQLPQSSLFDYLG